MFVDTSVLLRLVGIDGDEAARQIAAEPARDGIRHGRNLDLGRSACGLQLITVSAATAHKLAPELPTYGHMASPQTGCRRLRAPRRSQLVHHHGPALNTPVVWGHANHRVLADAVVILGIGRGRHVAATYCRHSDASSASRLSERNRSRSMPGRCRRPRDNQRRPRGVVSSLTGWTAGSSNRQS